MSRLPRVHRPSVTARAWADRWSLLLAGVVVLLATLTAAAVPPLMRHTADDAVTHAVRQAGRDAQIIVDAPLEHDLNELGYRARQERTTEFIADRVAKAKLTLGPDIQTVLEAPVASFTSDLLSVTDGSVQRRFELDYIARGDGPKVTWVAGAAPEASTPLPGTGSGLSPLDSRPWPVQVGLSETVARAMKLRPGDRVLVQDTFRRVKDVRVSGVYRPVDPRDPAWQAAPSLLGAVEGADGPGSTLFGGFLTADSVPDARLAMDEQQFHNTVIFRPDPDQVTWRSAESLVAAVVALKAQSGSSVDLELKWRTGLDGVLRDVRARIAAAQGQASVLLIGLVVTASLVLLLAADLLVRRRAGVLAGVRARGASLPGIGAELWLESAAVAVVSGGLGLTLSWLLTGGAAWTWALPVVLVSMFGGPVIGVAAAARATGGRRIPANRSARRAHRRTAQLRRVALEALVVLAAVGAHVALRQRGVLPTGPDDSGGNALPAAAPTLAAVVVALVLLRLLPPLTAVGIRGATRSRGGLALLGAARAAVTAARPLPCLVVVLSTALLTFALTLSATQSRGQTEGAWSSVGADARLDLHSRVEAARVVDRLTARPGVRQVVAARVADDVTVGSDATSGHARLLVVDPAALRRLRADTPLPDAPELTTLAGAPGGGVRVPALFRTSDPVLRRSRVLVLRWDDIPVTVAVVGAAPAVGDGDGNVLVVSAAAFAAAGAKAPPDTIWVGGPGAGAAVRAEAAVGDFTLRSDVLRDRREAPLAGGLFRLAYLCAALLLAFALLGVALGAAAGRPARGETLARLRTLGLRSREAQGVAAGELLPPVVVGVLGGLVAGVVLARASFGLLALRLLTGQAADPTLVVPWTGVAVGTVLPVAVVGVVIAVESSLRHRERLGEVLRAGG